MKTEHVDTIQMFNFHLFKRQANYRGILLLTLFCIYGLALLIATGIDVSREKGVFILTCCQHLLLLLTLVSLISPVIALLKPGYSYKGHPGLRHACLAVSGCSILTVCSVILINDFVFNGSVLDATDVILYTAVYPLHGIHSLVVYGSYFKGPTSKFGKVYQPFLPIFE